MDDPSLSRLHARIALDQDGQLSIDDMGSTNGIFVNGAEQLSAYLMLGDTVCLGRVYLARIALKHFDHNRRRVIRAATGVRLVDDGATDLVEGPPTC